MWCQSTHCHAYTHTFTVGEMCNKSTLTMLPVLAAKKHPHNRMLPPPCFTMFHSGDGLLRVVSRNGFSWHCIKLLTFYVLHSTHLNTFVCMHQKTHTFTHRGNLCNKYTYQNVLGVGRNSKTQRTHTHAGTMQRNLRQTVTLAHHQSRDPRAVRWQG